MASGKFYQPKGPLPLVSRSQSPECSCPILVCTCVYFGIPIPLYNDVAFLRVFRYGGFYKFLKCFDFFIIEVWTWCIKLDGGHAVRRHKGFQWLYPDLVVWWRLSLQSPICHAYPGLSWRDAQPVLIRFSIDLHRVDFLHLPHDPFS